jgi:hypothetical protein
MATLKDVLNGNADLLALAQAGKYAAVLSALEVRTQVNNPVSSAPLVPVPITLKAIMAQVPAAEMVKVYGLPGFVTDLRTAIADNDREYMGVLLQIALAASAISAASAAKLQPMLVATQADPTWTVKVPSAPRWQKLGLAALPSASDVQAVVHGGA